MIETNLHDDIQEIALSNPPVNALSHAVRSELLKTITDAQNNDAVKAIVICGKGNLFSAGADITEFGKPLKEPNLPEIIDAIEASNKPVIAAIEGSALGGGLEIALGCHYRIATKTAKLGLPEVQLGVLPGAGGTQRLPRLIGAAAALDIIVSGKPISAEKALELRLLDQLTDITSLKKDAITYARSLDAPRRTGDRKVEVDPDFFERYATETVRKVKSLDAPKACIEAVQATTTLPLNEGLRKEQMLFAQLVSGKQSKALRHAFFAERAAAKVEGLPKETQSRPVNKVGIIGAGTMGSGISMNFLSAGIPVTLVETQQDALDRGIRIIQKNYEATATKGRITTKQAATAMELLTTTLDFNALAECDLVIEAVYENMPLKQEIFAHLDSVAKPGAVLASNTSFLSIDEIASVTTRPQDVLGLHFFSPANIMKLLEVVRGAKTSPDVLATGIQLARNISKVPVVSGVCHGFIGNRMLAPRQLNAEALLLEGATPEQIDRVHTNYGMPMGPFQMADLAGLDIGWHRDPERIENLREALCARNRWGQKTNAGYYDYDGNRRPSPSSEADDIINNFRTKTGVKLREITEEEIIVRTFYTMVNEGAKILEENIAQRASDIDVVWNYGYGWPRYKGGPMYWANEVGLENIIDGLRKYADHIGSDFSISALLLNCAEQGVPLDKGH